MSDMNSFHIRKVLTLHLNVSCQQQSVKQLFKHLKYSNIPFAPFTLFTSMNFVLASVITFSSLNLTIAFRVRQLVVC